MGRTQWGALGLTILLAACGGGDGGGDDDGGGDAGGTGGTLVGPEGGVVTSDDGKVVVFVPAGAVESGTVDIAITEAGTGFPDEDTLLAPVYELGPDGAEFAVPVTLSIALDADEPAAIVTLDGSAWMELPASTVTAGRAFAQTTHFSTYSAAPPAGNPDPCLFRDSPAPLVVPGNVVVSNATQVDTSTAFSGADMMERGSRWEASAPTVTVSGVAGPPAGTGGYAVFGTMGEGEGTFDVAADGSFSLQLDLKTQGPWFALTDACLQPYATGPSGWLYNLEIACDPDCMAGGGTTPGTNVPECDGVFPATVTMEMPDGITSFRQAILGYAPGTTCGVAAPPDNQADGIFTIRLYPGSGNRTVTTIAGVNRWDIHDVSAGTYASATSVTDLPDGVDIDMGIMPVGQTLPTHRVWFRFDGNDLTIIALAEE